MNQFICICQNKNQIAPTPPVTKLSLAVQCLVIGPVCWFVCVWGSVITIARNCVHRSSPNWSVGEGSDHLKLFKFWPSCAPGKGVCGAGRKFLAQCLRLSESFFHLTTAARWVIAAFPYRLLLQFSRPPFHASFLILASSVSVPLIQRMRSLL